MIRPFRVMAAVLAVMLASACSHMPNVGAVLPTTSASVTPDLAPRERVRVAIELLGEGDARRAEAELEAALEEQPDLRAASRLLEQINGDPAQLLGGGNARAYTVRQGETMSELAERFLGDSLLFYALARYNDLDAPNQVSAGQTLMIPRRPGVVVASAPSTGAEAPATLRPTQPLASTPSATASRANELRLQGLQQLNGGNVERAVSLLRQARALDAGNPAIQRDLDRAVRLQASLGGAN